MIDALTSADHSHTDDRRPRRKSWYLVSLACLLAVLSAGCSSSMASRSAATAGSVDVSTTVAPWKQPACVRPAPAAVKSTKVTGKHGNFDLISFDGTRIRGHWFPRSTTAKSPTVLMGPGWSMAGDTSMAPKPLSPIMSVQSITALHKAGYNVLTWDPRGFGASGGTVTVDSPNFEARDVSRLLDWLATRPHVELDAMGDPRVGMVGASYGGGIQLVAAATDCRIDVITPTITWHSLRTSLYTADTFKSGWANILTKLGTGHRLDPHVTSASAAGNDSGVLSPGDLKWFSERGPGELLSQINVPTLIIQGTVDNLFPLDQGVRNYVGIAKNGAPTAMLWFCGGHGVCLTGDGGSLDIGAATLAWLDRYLKLDPHTKNVPGFETVDQNGAVHSFDSYPVPMGSPLSATGSGSLELTADGGSGPADTTGSSDPIASLAGPVTPAKATNAVNVPITNSKQRRLLLGAPVMRITYRGTSPAWVDGPQRVFAQVVDVKTGLVVGNQVTPVKLKLDGKVHTSTSALEIVVFDARPGAKLTLQLTPTTVAYAKPALGGSVRFSSVKVTFSSAK